MRPAEVSEARVRTVCLKFLLVPLVWLILGMVLGAATTLAVTGGSGSPSGNTAANPGRSPTAPAATPSGRTIAVPASCERGMARAQAAMQTLGEAGQALGNLESARLQTLLNQLQQAQADVDRLAAECREQARAAN